MPRASLFAQTTESIQLEGSSLLHSCPTTFLKAHPAPRGPCLLPYWKPPSLEDLSPFQPLQTPRSHVAHPPAHGKTSQGKGLNKPPASFFPRPLPLTVVWPLGPFCVGTALPGPREPQKGPLGGLRSLSLLCPSGIAALLTSTLCPVRFFILRFWDMPLPGPPLCAHSPASSRAPSPSHLLGVSTRLSWGDFSSLWASPWLSLFCLFGCLS